MKDFMENAKCKIKELNFCELLLINGGYSSTSSGSRTSYDNTVSLHGGYSFSNSTTPTGGTSNYSYATNIDTKKSAYAASSGLTDDEVISVIDGSVYSSVSGYLTKEQIMIKSLAERDETGEYKLGVNDCDIYVQRFLYNHGVDISEKWGDAVTNSTLDHVNKLKSEITSKPETGLSIVMMTDSDKYTLNHTALLVTNEDGSCTLYQNSKSNPYATTYKSVQAFQSDYAYKTFSYYSVKDN